MYDLFHWEGSEINERKPIHIELNLSDEELAGYCAFLYLLNITTESSYMIISKGSKSINPMVIIKKYLIRMEKSVLPSFELTKHIKNSCVLGYMYCFLYFKFNNKLFLKGIKNCCELLNRNINSFYLKTNLSKKKRTKSEDNSPIHIEPIRLTVSMSSL